MSTALAGGDEGADEGWATPLTIRVEVMVVSTLVVWEGDVAVTVVPTWAFAGRATVVLISVWLITRLSLLVLLLSVISGVLVATVLVPLKMPEVGMVTTTKVVVLVPAVRVPRLTVTIWPLLSVVVPMTALAVPLPTLVKVTVAKAVPPAMREAGRSR